MIARHFACQSRNSNSLVSLKKANLEYFWILDLFKFLNDNKNDFSIRSHAAPLVKSAETLDLLESEPSKNSEIVSFQSSHDTPIDLQDSDQIVETTLARKFFNFISIFDYCFIAQKRCDRLPYRSLCPDGLPSQL